MKEPQREEDTAAVTLPAGGEDTIQPRESATEPKAYAFDGWGMVPLEFDPA